MIQRDLFRENENELPQYLISAMKISPNSRSVCRGETNVDNSVFETATAPVTTP